MYGYTAEGNECVLLVQCKENDESIQAADESAVVDLLQLHAAFSTATPDDCYAWFKQSKIICSSVICIYIYFAIIYMHQTFPLNISHY